MPKAMGLLDYLTQHSVTLPEEIVHIEQWKRDVILRGLSSRERDLFEEDNLRRANAKAGNGARRNRDQINADLTNFRARLVARHIVEDGMRTFANDRGAEVLGEQPAQVLDKLFTVAQRLSGFTAEDIETLQGNSDATVAEGSSSSSPELSGELSLN